MPPREKAVPPPPPTKDEILKGFREKITDAMLVEMEKAKPESIVQSIIHDVRKQRQELVAQLLGYKDSFGRLEIDHCNGRTPAIDRAMYDEFGAQLRAVVKEEVAKTLADIKADKDHPFRKLVRTAIRQQALSPTDYEVRRLLDGAAKGISGELVEMAATEVRADLFGEQA